MRESNDHPEDANEPNLNEKEALVLINRFLEVTARGGSNYELGELAQRNTENLYRVLEIYIDQYDPIERSRIYSFIAPLESRMRVNFLTRRLAIETDESCRILLRALLETFLPERHVTRITDLPEVSIAEPSKKADETVDRLIQMYLQSLDSDHAKLVVAAKLHAEKAKVYEYLEDAIQTFRPAERHQLYLFLLYYGDRLRLVEFLKRQLAFENDVECIHTIQSLLEHYS